MSEKVKYTDLSLPLRVVVAAAWCWFVLLAMICFGIVLAFIVGFIEGFNGATP